MQHLAKTTDSLSASEPAAILQTSADSLPEEFNHLASLARACELNAIRGMAINESSGALIAELINKMADNSLVEDDPTAETKHFPRMPITARLAQGQRTEQQDASAYGIITGLTLESKADIAKVIAALRECDISLAQAKQFAPDGSTKTTCIVVTLMNGQRYILTSNCGDSGVYFAYRDRESQKFHVEALAMIHHLRDPIEVTRIRDAGGEVTMASRQLRLNSMLEMGRSFGDSEVGAGHISTAEYTLYPIPENCKDGHCFVFSDGFSDAISVALLARLMSHLISYENTVSLLGLIAYHLYPHDNSSLSSITLQQCQPGTLVYVSDMDGHGEPDKNQELVSHYLAKQFTPILHKALKKRDSRSQILVSDVSCPKSQLGASKPAYIRAKPLQPVANGRHPVHAAHARSVASLSVSVGMRAAQPPRYSLFASAHTGMRASSSAVDAFTRPVTTVSGISTVSSTSNGTGSTSTPSSHNGSSASSSSSTSSSSVSVQPSVLPISKPDYVIPYALVAVLYDTLVHSKLMPNAEHTQSRFRASPPRKPSHYIALNQAHQKYFYTHFILPLHLHITQKLPLPTWQEMMQKQQQSWQHQLSLASDPIVCELYRNPDLACMHIQHAYLFLMQLTEYHEFREPQVTLCDVVLILRALNAFCPYQRHQSVQSLIMDLRDDLKAAVARDQYAQLCLAQTCGVAFTQKESSKKTDRPVTVQNRVASVAVDAAPVVAEAAAATSTQINSKSDDLYQDAMAELKQFTLDEETSDAVLHFYNHYLQDATEKFKALTAKPETQNYQAFMIERLQQIFASAAKRASELLNSPAVAEAATAEDVDHDSATAEAVGQAENVVDDGAAAGVAGQGEGRDALAMKGIS